MDWVWLPEDHIQRSPVTAATALAETPAAPCTLAPLQTATISAANPTGPNIPGARNKDQAAHTRLARANDVPFQSNLGSRLDALEVASAKYITQRRLASGKT